MLIIRSEKFSLLHVFTFIPEKKSAFSIHMQNFAKNFHGCKSNPWKRENFSPWMISNIRYITANISNKILYSYYFILYIRGFKVRPNSSKAGDLKEMDLLPCVHFCMIPL